MSASTVAFPRRIATYALSAASVWLALVASCANRCTKPVDVPVDAPGPVAPDVRPTAQVVGCMGADAAAPLGALVTSPADVAIADVDGDGDMDLVVLENGLNPSDAAVSSVRILINQGNSLASQSWGCVQVSSGTPYQRLVLGDLDGDGHMDIVVGNYDTLQIAWWLLGTGLTTISSGIRSVNLTDVWTGGFACAATLVGAPVANLFSLSMGDIDGRTVLGATFGSTDLGESQACFNELFFGYDASTGLTSLSAVPGPGKARGRFADIDGDGTLDFVTSALFFTCPSGASGAISNCGTTGVWGWWHPGTGGTVTPLSTSVEGASPAVLPQFTALDFDVVPMGLAQRTGGFGGATAFAVAMTGYDQCQGSSCWTPEAGGGYLLETLVDGAVLWTSQPIEQPIEQDAAHGIFLSPTSIALIDPAAAGNVAATYRWMAFDAGADIARAGARDAFYVRAHRRERRGSREIQVVRKKQVLVYGPGALLGRDPSANFGLGITEYPAAHAMVRLALYPQTDAGGVGGVLDDTQVVAPGQRIAYLPARNIASVVSVGLVPGDGGAEVALPFSFYPNDSWVTLRAPNPGGRLHIRYRGVPGPAYVVANADPPPNGGLIVQDAAY